MALSRNLLAGLANSFCTALVGLAVIPIYLKYLGVETYGLIGLFTTIQALLSLLDLGMAPTISREMARCSATGNIREARNLLHTLSGIYVATAFVIFILIYGLTAFVANQWLQSSQLSVAMLERAIILMGFVVSCRWPSALYQGALMGMERLVLSSCINVVTTSISGIGAVSILAFISPTIEALFVWQAGVALINVAALRWAAWAVIGREGVGKFNIDALKRIWRFSAGLSGIALSAVLLTQLDKIVLSKMLSLAEFGQYVLASTVVGGLYLLITPVFNVVYPRFSALVAEGDVVKLTHIYRLWTNIFAGMFFPLAMLLAVLAKDIVLLWTRNPEIATGVAPIIMLLTFGSALHGIMTFTYALQLSYGMTRLPLAINSILLIIVIPLIVTLTRSYGAKGGAMAWLVFHVLYMLLGTLLTHRHLLKGVGAKWLFFDVGIPLLLSLIGGVLINYLSKENSGVEYTKMAYGGLTALVVSILSALLSPNFRSVVLSPECREKINGRR